MNSKAPITIFIHGTLPPKPVLHVPMVKRFFQCPKGICPIADLPSCHTKDILTSLCIKHPESFPQEHCYTFGWSGSLNHDARKEAAQELYRELARLKNSYEQKDIEPSISLLTHSHGGNVALCLKKVSDLSHNRDNISINKLILLACPIQLETADYIQDKLFKEVYSVHSHHDLLQVIDPQGIHTFLENLKHFGLEFTLSNLKELGPLFSERHFPKNSVAKQLNVKYPHRELLHIEFLLPTFIDALPAMITKMNQSNPQKDELVHVFTQEAKQ